MISGNASSAAMAEVTGGRLGSLAITTPYTDWCKMLPSESLSPTLTAVVST